MTAIKYFVRVAVFAFLLGLVVLLVSSQCGGDLTRAAAYVALAASACVLARKPR